MTRKTLARSITVTGTALHAGATVTMTLAPAAPETGIVFHRADLGADIAARFDLVGETRLGTVITDGEASVGVIEHLMAAVAGAEIDDLLVTLDGPEPPILDGDASAYLALLTGAGLRATGVARHAIKVVQPVMVEQGDARAALHPAETRSYYCEISFASAVIGTQAYDFAFSPESFRSEIAPARTFGFVSELEHLNKMGLARGANLDNTLAIDGDGLLNADRRRFPDEFVRHKILDAIGDLALAGAPLLARFEGIRSGHATNNALLRALFADPANYAWVEL